jgi:hypothetical protein
MYERGAQHKSGKSYQRGRLSTVDLHVPTILEQLIFILKMLFTGIYKTSYLN